MHVNNCRRLLAASSLALVLAVQPCRASTASQDKSRSFQARTPAADRFIEPQSTAQKIHKSSLAMDMVRGEGIEDDILKKNKKSLMGIISRVFDNEFSKGAERSHVAKKLDTLAMAGHMFTYEQRHHIVLGMAVASAKEMRAVARTRDGAAYINDVFSTFIKTAPEMRGRLGEVRAWVFSEEKPEALADRLIGTIGTAGKQ